MQNSKIGRLSFQVTCALDVDQMKHTIHECVRGIFEPNRKRHGFRWFSRSLSLFVDLHSFFVIKFDSLFCSFASFVSHIMYPWNTQFSMAPVHVWVYPPTKERYKTVSRFYTTGLIVPPQSSCFPHVWRLQIVTHCSLSGLSLWILPSALLAI